MTLYVVYLSAGLAFACWALRSQLRRIRRQESVVPEDYVGAVSVAWAAGVFWPAVALVALPVWLVLRYEAWRGVHEQRTAGHRA